MAGWPGWATSALLVPASVSITTRTGDWQEKPVISTVARFAHSDGRRAVAQWLNGRAESAYAWRAGFVIDPIQAKRSFRDLGKELKDA